MVNHALHLAWCVVLFKALDEFMDSSDAILVSEEEGKDRGTSLHCGEAVGCPSTALALQLWRGHPRAGGRGPDGSSDGCVALP